MGMPGHADMTLQRLQTGHRPRRLRGPRPVRHVRQEDREQKRREQEFQASKRFLVWGQIELYVIHMRKKKAV